MIGFASTCAVLTYHSAHLLRLRHRDRTQTIGVVAKHASTRFFEVVIRGIDDVAAQHGALVLTATTRTADRGQATLLALSSPGTR
jgi:LacI family transcriptional regulator